MDFGKVSPKELESVDFSLPKEPAANKLVLSGIKTKHPEIYIGCAKWGRKEWIGKIYPKGTKDANFLEHYVKHYNSIELNATHYKIYDAAAIAKWAAKAKGIDFKFCPKVPQAISHYSGFNNVDAITDSFLEGILAFKEHLGPVFLQVSERFSPNQRDKLFNYLRSLPVDLQFFLEVRHPDWFTDKIIRKELFDTLRSLNIGAVITDTAGRRDCAHMELTVPKTFIRYVGNSLHKTDYTRTDAWIKRLKYWMDHGLEELYYFMHMHNEATSPELTIYLVDKINKELDVKLKKPVFINKQQDLF
ncbi:DUF72 domain-containing protein [Ferruginibacter albus]|uniref:DUF72 domain-containing protein n=1 Tax=Ferruginibacter albus TaxID=2875540 RepID=UPI001CC5F18E|nr:DUF72 domain-containing protein [Ferruginibacter albus]UAY52066.1 DUF72 domain-containing protein [Ferruginibacter albus]